MDISNKVLLDMLRERLTEIDRADMMNHEIFRELLDLSRKLKASEQLKSNFLSNVRNEINNPLSSILGLSRVLASATEQNFQQFRNQAAMLYQETFQLDCKIRNIIAAAEIEAGEHQPNFVRMNVRESVESILRSFEFKCQQKNLRVSLNSNIADGDHFITDPYMFFIVVLNLISNGIEFSEPDTEIFIDVSKREDVRITVRDCGKGILPRDRDCIFDRFRQLEEGTTKRHNGQGLGLSVAREFAEAIGGSLELTKSDQTGSTFLFIIPSHDHLDIRRTAVGGWNDVLFENSEVL